MDRIGAIERTMKRLGYKPDAIRWVKNLATGDKSLIYADGHSGGSMRYTRALLQGFDSDGPDRWALDRVHFRDYDDYLKFDGFTGRGNHFISTKFRTPGCYSTLEEINKILGSENPTKDDLLLKSVGHPWIRLLVEQAPELTEGRN